MRETPGSALRDVCDSTKRAPHIARAGIGVPCGTRRVCRTSRSPGPV